MSTRTAAEYLANGASRNQISNSRRQSFLIALTLVITMFGAVNQARAQTGYPVRQVRIVVAFAPGGIADVMARMVGQKLSAKFGQTFVIENRPGAGGTLGAKVVSGAPSDGYTLLVTTTGLAINSVAMKNSVDPHTQLTPIAQMAVAPMIFIAPKDVTAPDLVTFLRSVKKGQFTYSSAGVGTAEHLTSEFLYRTTPGLDATHVPFTGGAGAVNAVLTKTVDLATATLPSALSLMQSGDLRVFAVVSHKRLASLPDVPTLKEAGLADLATASWIGVFGPPDLPVAIAEQLNAEINAALVQQDVGEKLTSLGFEVQPRSQKDFSESLAGEVAEWSKIVKTIGFAPN
jgi:tripartite-type tricarboxylate transporter receptor subunit TctC